MLETLVTVGITVILLAFSAVGVARLRDNLKITELDNAARAIYMAAENRAVLLHNRRRLDTELEGTSVKPLSLPDETKDITDGTSYVLWEGTESGRWGELLPAGAIDPALRKGWFYIVYEALSGSVTDVFYSEKDISGISIADAFELAKQGRDARMRNKPMLGWFGGGASGMAAPPLHLSEPQVTVNIENGEELKVTVTFIMPEDLPDGVTVMHTASVKLTYGDTTLELLSLPYDSRRTNTGNIGTGTATRTWVLDSLESGKQFKELPGLDPDVRRPGGDFTVTAELMLEAPDAPEYSPVVRKAEDTNNSLFAKGSAGADNTAYIDNLRHLQNLHPGHSKVMESVTMAQQREDIDCRGAKPADKRYEFIPIENPRLTSYSGKNGAVNTHIDNLYIKRGVTDAGLFGKVTSSLTITDCRVRWTSPGALVDGVDYVYAVSGENAGGLIGSAVGDPDREVLTEVSIINSFAATTAEGTDYAGGLVGSVGTYCYLTVRNSYADCYLTSAAGYCGGLVGALETEDATKLTLNNCYAAGFISAEMERACGLASSHYVTAANCYSAVRVLRAGGAVEKPGVLLYGPEMGESGSLRYLSDPTEILAGAFGPSFEYTADKPDTNAYDLRRRLDSANPQLTGLYPYPGVKDTAGNTLPHYGDWGALSGPFPAGLVYYEKYSRAYNGQMYGMVGVFEGTELDTGLPGDDTVYVDSDTQIVRDGYALAFPKGSEPDPKLSIIYATRRSVPSGYVMPNAQEWTVQKDGDLWDWEQTDGGGGSHPDVAAFTVKAGEKEYTCIPLPDGIVNGYLPGYMRQKDPVIHSDLTTFFYQQLICGEAEDDEVEHSARSFWFNPHFAKTVVKPGASHAEPANNRSSAVRIRTPRHLYRLSAPTTEIRSGTELLHLWYSGCGESWVGSWDDPISKNYFLQELDLDYAAYTEGYEGYFRPEAGNLPFYQEPIGFIAIHGGYTYGHWWGFSGTYNGDCHRIKNVFLTLRSFNSSAQTASCGLFGLITDARLENIIYELNPEVCVRRRSLSKEGDLTSNEREVIVQGTLVGFSRANNLVKNCAVYGVNTQAGGEICISDLGNALIADNKANSMAKCVGGLVGYNGSTCRVENCSAELVSLTAEKGSVAGLVGTNAGVIDSCYAVGKIATGDSGQTLSGLVGKNMGTVTNSYAAVNLSGEASGKYGLSPNAVSSGNCWLEGTFTYRGEEYTAGAEYNNGGGSSVKVSALAAALPALSPVNLTNTVRYEIPADKDWKAKYPDTAAFPYRSGVKRGAASAHYGLWPVEVPLDAELVYWEGYSADSGSNVTTYGLDFGPGDARSSLVDSKVIREDGYALAFERADAMAGGYEVKYGPDSAPRTWTLEKSGTKWQWKKSGGTAQDADVRTTNGRTVILLPKEEVTVNDLPVPGSFYQKLTVRPLLTGGTAIPRTYYFNPHFAKSVRVAATAASAAPDNPTAEAAAAIVRTPRHLYDLSKFQSTYATKSYYYKQELSLDYSKYTGYGIWNNVSAANPCRQDPIGTDTAAFAGKYDGKGYTISGVLCNYNSNTDRGGLFGSSTGTLQKIVYDMGGDKRTVTVKEGAYFGGLLGRNISGRVQDCTVRRVNMTTAVQGISIGGLIGYSDGVAIERCKSETVTLESTRANANVGGLVGSNATGSSITDCVVTGANLTNGGKSNVGGLVGSNSGAVKGTAADKCYATVTNLTNNGGEAKVGGLVGSITGAGTVTSCKATVANLTTTGATSLVGGLVGSSAGTGAVTSCSASITNKLNVTTGANANVGGLVGSSSNTVQDCTATVKELSASSSGANVGGLVGSNSGTVKGTAADKCKATVTTLNNTGANANVGGLVGSNTTGSSITDCVATVTTLTNGGKSNVGGLVGSNSGTVKGTTADKCYATVTNLTNNGGEAKVGGLVGSITGAGTVTSCKATVSNLTTTGADAMVGGLVGSSAGTGAVTSCSASITNKLNVTTGANAKVGGLVGSSGNTVQDCTATVKELINSSSGANVGGLVGSSSGTVKGTAAGKCKATVTTLNNNGENAKVGGLVGQNSGTVTGTVTGTATVNVTVDVPNRVGKFTETSGSINTVTLGNMTNSAKQAKIGGLVGYNSGTIEKCSAKTEGNLISEVGQVSGAVQTYVGGLVGWNYVGGTINSCRATVNSLSSDNTVQAYDIYVGGLVGENLGTVTSSVAQATTMNGKGQTYRIGGLVGENNGTLSRCMSDIGSLTGAGSNNRTGGLVGTHNGLGSKIEYCYSKVGNLKGDGSGGRVSLGGLVGYSGNGDDLTSRIENSWTTVTTMNAINSNEAVVGGLVGWEGQSGIMKTCYARVTTISSSNVTGYFGKWVGSNTRGNISGCSADITTPSNLKNIGYTS